MSVGKGESGFYKRQLKAVIGQNRCLENWSNDKLNEMPQEFAPAAPLLFRDQARKSAPFPFTDVIFRLRCADVHLR